VHMNTNGDLMTKELADELDGVFDFIIVHLYMEEPVKSKRAFWFQANFLKTEIRLVTDQPHMPTHFTPAYNLEGLIEDAKERNCPQPTIRTTINHKGEYLPCCDDMIGNFDLGTFPEVSIADNWFGKQAKIAEDLSHAGGRAAYPYCMICPNGAPWR
ncbi:MAG: SPASM domain-containing protein, partial [Thermoplasmata archaeon]|nr:SPASM domain-containing protein [Thermoplasmata archaeon]